MAYYSDIKPLTNQIIDKILERYYNAGYIMPKWISFSICMLNNGFTVRYYASKTTVSKYIYVSNPKTRKEVKVRFSNHKPSVLKENTRDSDFYVGYFNNGIITTEAVIPKVLNELNQK